MIAFVCGTPVHILRALHMKYTMNEFSEAADCYLCKTFNGVEEIAHNIEQLGIFQSVIVVDMLHNKRAKVLRMMYGFNELATKVRKRKYTKLIAFNIESEIANAIYNTSKKNTNFEYHCVEDAPGLYPLYAPINYRGINRLLGIEKAYFHMSKWWFSQPDVMHLPNDNQAIKSKLPLINKEDKEFVRMINSVFAYEPDELFNNADILIMEESFYTDGKLIGNGDFEIFKRIKERYPDKKILVKLHPRTKVNRFEEDFDIMKSTWIPWEVHLLNQDANASRNPVQLGIVCTAMSSDKFLFGVEGRKIVLAPLFYNQVKNKIDGSPGISIEDTRKFEKLKATYQNPENFVIVHSYDEITEALDRMIR